MRAFESLRDLCRSRRGDCLGMMAAGTVLAALGLGDARPEGAMFASAGAGLLALGIVATSLALSRGGAAR